eukprot:scaffold43122_cov15-Tisochrysis_lutea.AAC.1
MLLQIYEREACAGVWQYSCHGGRNMAGASVYVCCINNSTIHRKHVTNCQAQSFWGNAHKAIISLASRSITSSYLATDHATMALSAAEDF